MSKQYIKGITAGIIILVLISLIFIGGSYFSGPKEETLVNNTIDEFMPQDVTVTTYSPDDHILGPTVAQVLMISYSDLDCPHCKYFHSILEQAVDGYAGKVAWIYRHFPISGASAELKAEASECASELGGNKSFWRYIDAIYAYTDEEDTDYTKEVFTKLARDIDLDENEFAACLESDMHKELVQEHMDSGTKAGVSGTPTTFLISRGKQHKLIGAVTFEEIIAAVQSFTYL